MAGSTNAPIGLLDGARSIPPTFVAICVASFAAMASFYLLLPVAPLLVIGVGGTKVQAGMGTGAIMLMTVIAECCSGRLQSQWNARQLLVGSIIVIGGPALILGWVSSVSMILILCAVRGFGLGVLLVVSGAAVAGSFPEHRKAWGLSIYGVIVAVPAMVMLPAGPWALAAIGPKAIGIAGALAAFSGLPALGWLGTGAPALVRHEGLWRFARRREALEPAITLFSGAVAAGICTSLLSLIHGWADGRLVATALLAHSCGAVLARGSSGLVSGRAGQRRLVSAGLLLTTIGLVALAYSVQPGALVAAMAILGTGFGLVQNPTFVQLLKSGPSAGANASAVWNFAYDAGLGFGAVLFGSVASAIGSGPTLVAIAAITLLALGFGKKKEVWSATRPAPAERTPTAVDGNQALRMESTNSATRLIGNGVGDRKRL